MLGLVANLLIARKGLACLIGEVLQGGAGFKKPDCLTTWSFGIQLEKLGQPAFTRGDINHMELVRKINLLKHNQNYDAIRGWVRIELKPVNVLYGPAFGDDRIGELKHI